MVAREPERIPQEDQRPPAVGSGLEGLSVAPTGGSEGDAEAVGTLHDRRTKFADKMVWLWN